MSEHDAHAAAGDRAAAMLQLQELSKSFGGLRALDCLTLSVRRGDIHSLIGPNGAGKTCVFNCTMGQYRPDSGTILFEGLRIEGLAPDRVALAGITRTYQNIRLFRNMTAQENVMVGYHTRLRSGLWDTLLATPRFRREEAEAQTKARQLLDLVGLSGRGHLPARALAYGEQRRLEIARALAAGPRLLLLDEPAAGMNPAESDRLMTLIGRIRDERELTIILIEHEMRLVMGISDRISVLDRGRLLAEGLPQEIRRDERVIAAYLGTGPAAQRLAAQDRREY
jgi:branched-chain amino acid transport system ATP-binding protein